MAAASSGDLMEREAGSELLGMDSLQSEKSGLESEKSEAPQEGTEDHMNVVERHLDELTFCGSTVNDLELQLGRERALYRQTLAECKTSLEETRRRLGACIPKSEPFIEVWRRARQIQEESNKAAARFDKASSQYAAAKEMIRVAESQLATLMAQSDTNKIPNKHVSTKAGGSDVNHAWLEMLNHATTKVVETEREKRASEAEHRKILDHCTAVLEEYRVIERKLRPHIIKSRPFYEERWRSSQRLSEIRGRISSLEEQLRNTKQRYANTLHHLDQLNHSLHRQRRANSLTPVPTASQSSSPDLAQRRALDHSDTDSVLSWQMGGAQFTGSTGSLPSIGSSLSDGSVEDVSQSLDKPLEGGSPACPVIKVVDEDRIAQLAKDLVKHSLDSALSRLRQKYCL